MKLQSSLWRQSCAGALLGLAMLQIHSSAWAQNNSPALINILPSSTVIATEGDAPFWWNAVAPIRANKYVAQGLAQVATTGFSPDTDFASWAGQTAIAFLTPTAGTPASPTPSLALFIQIKDQAAFDKTLEKVKAKGVFDAKNGVKTVDRGGVSYYSFGKGAASAPQIGMAVSQGYVIFGMGNGVIESCIDTLAGTTPGVTASPAWAQAVKTIPASPVGWIVMDTAGYTRAVGKYANMFGGARKNSPAMPDPGPAQETIIAQGITAQNDGFSSSFVSVPSTDRARAFFTDLASLNTKPVDATMLNRVPDASGAVLYSSGTVMWKYISSYYSQMLIQDPKMAQQFGPMLLAATTAAAQYPGQVGMFLTARPGHGIGFVLEAQAMSHEAALASATGIAGMLTQMKVPVVQTGDSWKIGDPAGARNAAGMKQMMAMAQVFGEDVNPTLEVDGNYLEVTTSPTWTHETEIKPSLTLPASSGNSFAVAFGNGKWLQPVETWLNGADAAFSASTPNAPSFVDLAKGIGLDNANWQQVTSLNADGTMSGTGSITGWDWNKGLAKTVDWVTQFGTAMSAAHQQSAEITPLPEVAPPHHAATAPVHHTHKKPAHKKAMHKKKH